MRERKRNEMKELFNGKNIKSDWKRPREIKKDRFEERENNWKNIKKH